MRRALDALNRALDEMPNHVVAAFRRSMGECGPHGFNGDPKDPSYGAEYDGEPIYDREYRRAVEDAVEGVRSLIQNLEG